MDEKWLPALDRASRRAAAVSSSSGVTYGDGRTLQEAADDLVWRLLAISNSVRASGLRLATELGPPDRRVLDLIWEAGELGERGEDVRARVFGPSTERRPTRVGDDPEG